MIGRLFRVFSPAVKCSSGPQVRPFHIFRRYDPFFDFDEGRKFRLMLDVEDFRPGDIDVKVDGKKILISAHKSSSHANWRDSTQITREYDIPEDVDSSTIKSNVDSGLLVIEGDRRITGDAKHIEDEKDYIMKIDLNGYEQKDISVKQDGHEITIEAKQEVKNVEGDQCKSKCLRRFLRRFMLPHNVDHNAVQAKFTADGRLVLKSPYLKGAIPTAKSIEVKEE